MGFLTTSKRVVPKETAIKRAGLSRAATQAKADAAKANSPLELAKRTLMGVPKAVLDVGKDIARGSVEFAVSAGEAPVRLAAAAAGRKDIAAAQLPGAKIPGLDALGEVKSFQTKAAEKKDAGASDLEAIGGGIGETLLNEPLGVAVKPLAVLGGLAIKAGGGKALFETVQKIIRGGKKAAVEAPVAPAARRDAEFEGMTLEERLAATGERKVPVFGDTSLRPIPVEGQSKATPVPFANDYREGPAIVAGPKGRKTGDLPVIKPGEATPPGAGRSGPVSEAPGPLQAVATQSRTPRAPRATPEKPIDNRLSPSKEEIVTPVSRETPVADPVATPVAVAEDGRKASGLAKGVESAAVEKKLTEGFEGVSGYDTINMKDQAERAGKLVADDYDRAKRVALGLEKAPEGTRDFSVYVAVEKQAQKEGDVETLRRLATMSRLNEESSGAAQTLRILAERDPDSPVAAIADIARARLKGAEKRGIKPAQVKADVKAAKAEIAKAPKEDWGSFVDSITC